MTRSSLASRRAAPLLLALAAAACGSGEAPGTLSSDERRQLNEAAEMLDANSMALEEVTTNAGEDD